MLLSNTSGKNAYGLNQSDLKDFRRPVLKELRQGLHISENYRLNLSRLLFAIGVYLRYH